MPDTTALENQIRSMEKDVDRAKIWLRVIQFVAGASAIIFAVFCYLFQSHLHYMVAEQTDQKIGAEIAIQLPKKVDAEIEKKVGTELFDQIQADARRIRQIARDAEVSNSQINLNMQEIRKSKDLLGKYQIKAVAGFDGYPDVAPNNKWQDGLVYKQAKVLGVVPNNNKFNRPDIAHTFQGTGIKSVKQLTAGLFEVELTDPIANASYIVLASSEGLILTDVTKQTATSFQLEVLGLREQVPGVQKYHLEWAGQWVSLMVIELK